MLAIKTQKIIRFIPIVNILTVFCWIKMYMNNGFKCTDFLKSLLKIFLIIILINVPRMASHFLFKNETLDQILYWVSVYFSFFGMSVVAVADQEKYLNKS